ncbi:MAG: ACT domain-containing protein, partial [Bacilli bacterium]
FYDYLVKANLVVQQMKHHNDEITFLVNEVEINDLNNYLDLLNNKNNLTFTYDLNHSVSCLTLVGHGFKTSSLLVVQALNVLRKNNINVEQSLSTNLSLSFIIPKEEAKDALSLLAHSFKL